MILIYNTLAQKKEILRPKRNKKLNIFVCGPTVYDFSHIGHARTYAAFDMIAKYLGYIGFDVFYLQNITDIDDKIIQRARERNQNPKALARTFEKEYARDMKTLGIDSVTKHARATDYIPEIISQTERLLKKGYAYEMKGDGIYFDISRFKDYGKLSKRTTQQAQDAVSRIDESVHKRNKGDFALWKFSPPSLKLRKSKASPEPSWPSPFGPGRPGWHIEDTAITEKYFGPQYDIHGGAQDLIFPHHEAEITQMESISGKKPFVRYWMHTGFLTVKGEKMSKSLGNFITIRDFLDLHSARLLRFFVLKTHYRSPIDYSDELLSQAKNELDRIDEFVGKLTARSLKLITQKSKRGFEFQVTSYEKRVKTAMEDDFNTPRALATIFEMITKGNIQFDQENVSRDQAKQILEFLEDIDAFFGFIFWGKAEKEKIPETIIGLVSQREMCRKQNEWQKADELRQQIKEAGWLVEDTEHGPEIKKCLP